MVDPFSIMISMLAVLLFFKLLLLTAAHTSCNPGVCCCPWVPTSGTAAKQKEQRCVCVVLCVPRGKVLDF